MIGAEHDVIVAGDGPAAAAVVHACRRHGLDVIAIGPSGSWPGTYGLWRDEVSDLPDRCFAGLTAGTVVRARTERLLARPYGVIDNAALRAHLGLDEVRVHGRVARQVDTGDLAIAQLDDGELLAARWLVDATGRTDAAVWQTAYGVVVSAADLDRAGYSTQDATVMAWLADVEPSCFVYAVPVGCGWMVEVTSLAARPAVEPHRLRRVLVDVIGEAPVVAAEALGRAETVRIPMGGHRLPTPGGRVIPFGTAGGIAHPATGYSVAASLAAAGRLVSAIAAGTDPVEALWSPSTRRARTLHEGGLEVVLGLGRDGVVDFFEAFFAIPPDLWADYLRVDAPDHRVAAAMRAVFRTAPWSVRRRLLGLDRRMLGLLVRSSVGSH
ncbi:MAG TPA: lycopene cyclase family protein [Ilumatobacter sp.]|nr:lycopene cyclase family protein [Ilumatobacter sp.]